MAAIAAPLLPRLAVPAFPAVSRWATLYTTRYTSKLFPTLSIALPGVSLNLPELLGDIWEGLLRAVPKNKTSHSRKRHRQMAGKALKDVQSLCKCPGCGATKRTHRLCQHCLNGTDTCATKCGLLADSVQTSAGYGAMTTTTAGMVWAWLERRTLALYNLVTLLGRSTGAIGAASSVHRAGVWIIFDVKYISNVQSFANYLQVFPRGHGSTGTETPELHKWTCGHILAR